MSLEDQLNHPLKILGVYISRIEGRLCLTLPGSIAVSAISKRRLVNSTRGGRTELLTQQFVFSVLFTACLLLFVMQTLADSRSVAARLALHRKQNRILSEF
jgi:hypothetical protein